MPHKKKFKFQTPRKTFGKNKFGKVLKLSSHDTTTRLHLTPNLKKDKLQIINEAYVPPTGDRISQTSC